MSTQHSRPCLDKYPSHTGFISDSEIRKVAMSKMQMNAHPATINNAFEKLKAAFKVSAVWTPGSEIRIAFLDGTAAQKDWVQKVVSTYLEPICDTLKFTWNVPVQTSDIRISFSLPNQAWSYVGTDALAIPKTDMTMNLGWIDNDTDYDAEPYKGTGQVVIHEFCHALGMIHEHQNPKGNAIQWNKPVVYAELKRTNGWSAEQTDQNMFLKYGDKDQCAKAQNSPPYPGRDLDIQGYCSGDLVNGSEYDVHSIMHYWYPSTWVMSGSPEIPINTHLSDLDKLWLNKYYGSKKASQQPPFNTAPSPSPSPSSSSSSMIIIIISLLVLVFACIFLILIITKVKRNYAHI
jgi:hypothetical protein